MPVAPRLEPPLNLPDVFVAGWALRPDQADEAARVFDDELPDDASGTALVRVEARAGEERHARWVALTEDDVADTIERVGRDLLGPDVDANVPVYPADLRYLDERGRTAARNEPCFCGRGTKAKRCNHVGPALVVTTAHLVTNQGRWDLMRGDDPDGLWDLAPEDLTPGHWRIAANLHTPAGYRVVTTTVDFRAGGGLEIAMENVEASLSRATARVASFLAESVMQIEHAPLQE